MGRRMPTKEDYERERGLQIIATKGVIQLFNAVTDFQQSMSKEAFKEEKEKRQVKQEKIDEYGKDKNTGAVGFSSQSMIEKI